MQKKQKKTVHQKKQTYEDTNEVICKNIGSLGKQLKTLVSAFFPVKFDS